MKAVDRDTGYVVIGRNIVDVMDELNGGDYLAIYRDGFIDVYDSDVSDREAEADEDGELAFLHMEIID